MNTSIITNNQGVNNIYFNNAKSESHKGSTAGKTNGSDTVHFSEKAIELSQKDELNNTEDVSNVVGKKNTDLDKALALFKEVGLEEYRKIMKTLKQIEKALAKTIDDFPAYKETLEALGKDLNDNLPSSANEAMSRLNKALDVFPKEIREDIRESLLKHLEEEKEKDSKLARKDSELTFTLGQAG
ncbi:MAG: hypothetical protein PVG39_19990 [Desulfobacteraceae bacterium]|jgi:hypothetical protein